MVFYVNAPAPPHIHRKPHTATQTHAITALYTRECDARSSAPTLNAQRANRVKSGWCCGAIAGHPIRPPISSSLCVTWLTSPRSQRRVHYASLQGGFGFGFNGGLGFGGKWKCWVGLYGVSNTYIVFINLNTTGNATSARHQQLHCRCRRFVVAAV